MVRWILNISVWRHGLDWSVSEDGVVAGSSEYLLIWVGNVWKFLRSWAKLGSQEGFPPRSCCAFIMYPVWIGQTLLQHFTDSRNKLDPFSNIYNNLQSHTQLLKIVFYLATNFGPEFGPSSGQHTKTRKYTEPLCICAIQALVHLYKNPSNNLFNRNVNISSVKNSNVLSFSMWPTFRAKSSRLVKYDYNATFCVWLKILTHACDW